METMKIITKRVKIRNLVLLILLLITNTYAWFIYSTEVNTDISVHVKSWNVEFYINGSTTSVTNMTIDIQNAYPGMSDFVRVVNVYNDGETSATLSYELESARIMNTTTVAANK